MALDEAALRPPAEVLEIAERLERSGFETWFVGGAVRDALLGIPDLDWDLATSARPDDVRKLFQRTVPHGIRFGTIGVLDRSGRMHEVTTFRRDVETDGRHAVVEFGASLDDDLARRDFTINAIAWAPRRGIRDPFGGRADLERRQLRAVGDPRERMKEDRLRALRALRFAARFRFRIDPDTWKAIAESAPHLTRLSAERVQQEIQKTMEQVARPGAAMQMWRESGALRVLLPPIEQIDDVALATLDKLPMPAGKRADQRLVLRIAALFMDLPPRSIVPVLKGLRFSNDRIDWIAGLAGAVGEVGASIEAALAERMPEPVQLRRWASTIGRTRVPGVLRLLYARWSARRDAGRDAPDTSRSCALYRRMVAVAYRDPLSVRDLAIDGEDLMSIGVPEGPGIRQIQNALLDRVLEDPRANQRDTLMTIAREKARELIDHRTSG